VNEHKFLRLSSLIKNVLCILSSSVLCKIGMYRISDWLYSLSGSGSSSWQWRNQKMKPDNFTTVDSFLCCTLDANQDITGSNMKLVSPATQQCGCPCQTSTVPKLLSAHSDGAVDSTQLSVCLMVFTSISVSGKFRFQPDSRVNCPATIWFRPDSENPYLVHP